MKQPRQLWEDVQTGERVRLVRPATRGPAWIFRVVAKGTGVGVVGKPGADLIEAPRWQRVFETPPASARR